LYFGAIPIIKSSFLDPMYKRLGGCWIVNDWSEVTEEECNRRWENRGSVKVSFEASDWFPLKMSGGSKRNKRRNRTGKKKLMYGGQKKKFLIYACVFHQEKYIDLLDLLIKSISLKAKLNKDTTDILIITSPVFLPLIQKRLSEYSLPLVYMTLDLHTKMEASCCKLNVFDYKDIDKYAKILYLDTDVLINSDINILFNLEISSDKIYTLEEGTIGGKWWGKEFFDFTKFDVNTPAFSAGVFFFTNNINIKTLFSNTKKHIDKHINIDKKPAPETLDQPFLVYNAFIENKYDNQMLKKYMENNPTVVNKEKIIYHFPGGPGDYTSKLDKMNTFLLKQPMNGGQSVSKKDKVLVCPKYISLLGDSIVISGAVHYLTTQYNEVSILCGEKYRTHVESLYSENPAVKMIFLNGESEIEGAVKKSQDEGYEIRRYISDGWSEGIIWPNLFYDELNVPRSARRDNFHIKKTEASKNIYDSIKHRHYIVVHQETSQSSLPIVEFLRSNGETRLIIDLNRNQVDVNTDPEGYNLANSAINKPIADYVDLLEGAEELHLIDSAILCLATQLDLSRVKNRKFYRRNEAKNIKNKMVDNFGLFEEGSV